MSDQTIEQKIKDIADRAYCRNCLHYIRVNYDSIDNVVNRQGFCLLGRCEGDFSLYVSCGCSECMGYVLSKEHYDITFAEKKIDRECEAFAESCEDRRTANYKLIEPLRAETDIACVLVLADFEYRKHAFLKGFLRFVEGD